MQFAQLDLTGSLRGPRRPLVAVCLAEPSPDIDELLRALDEDPSGIFWG